MSKGLVNSKATCSTRFLNADSCSATATRSTCDGLLGRCPEAICGGPQAPTRPIWSGCWQTDGIYGPAWISRSDRPPRRCGSSTFSGDRFTWEPQAAEILGVSPDQLPSDAAALAAVAHPADRDVVRSALGRLLAEGATDVGLRIGQNAQQRSLSLRGRILDRDRTGQPLRAVGLLLDVTTEKAMEEQLLRMSVSDALTGTPNRRAFDQALRGEWRRCHPCATTAVDSHGRHRQLQAVQRPVWSPRRRPDADRRRARPHRDRQPRRRPRGPLRRRGVRRGAPRHRYGRAHG